MIKYLSTHVPMKVKRKAKYLTSLLFQINTLSGRDYRLYFDDTLGILVDITKNKILWIADATFSVAIFEGRLRVLLEYWTYEKTIDKTEIDFVRFDYLKKYFKSHYYE